MIAFSSLLLAPLVALMAPVGVSAPDGGRERQFAPKEEAIRAQGKPKGMMSLVPLEQEPKTYQIRIQRRVIVRISPRRSTGRRDLDAQSAQPVNQTRLRQQKMGKCLPVTSIAGVQPGNDNKLVLFLRNRGLVGVHLDKACRARDFYSGFYVERNSDGLVCAGRDMLQSRSGAKCDVAEMVRLVAVRQ
ncbi:hypothetical protein HME9302_01408 [Alteripontixanthobacter maritimus]|uniref:Uncharacterized protein n=1 Tax=Alteripontixanthobacter maritimus TaxID=2161824 RepID=A0A369QD46_9SPHN|nr:hypothetical protein [Alteripontixanthobacter maritimus]RDC60208.1 hypothetical protein HME9302_01408 [Alteripontixanthobacter maritimus]